MVVVVVVLVVAVVMLAVCRRNCKAKKRRKVAHGCNACGFNKFTKFIKSFVQHVGMVAHPVASALSTAQSLFWGGGRGMAGKLKGPK